MNLFPFSAVRSGQEELMQDVAATVASGGNLAAHAPTGIGKTAGVLVPALEYALERGKTVFFLTPKHTQHIIVIDTLQKVHKKFNVSINVVDIIGKQWMCPQNVANLDSREFNEFCRTQKKDELCEYYNNTRKAKFSENAKKVVAQIHKEPVHNEAIKKMCAEKNLCPYEVCVEAGKTANVIVCDYFHIFSPQVRRAFLLKLGKKLEDAIIIVDEAHNLPERVRSLLSFKLTDNMLNRAGKEASSLGARHVVEDLHTLERILKKFSKGFRTGEEKFVGRDEFMEDVKESVKSSYIEFVDELSGIGEEVLKIPGRFRSYTKSVANFLDGWKGENLGYARIMKREDQRILLSNNCLDPSVSSKEVFDNAYSSILMSGTLLPLNMYSSLLGLNVNRSNEKVYKSPFPKENRMVLLVPSVTTKYSHRSDFMYQKYARQITEVLESIPGNVAVFYPSYFLLETITQNVKTKREIILERHEMKREDRRQLYNRLLHSRNNGGGVLMAVQAGSFSEGMDYPENLLDAVVIVGLPLERPDLETQSLIDYYDFKFERGWDYGYIYPAMNRALQAAGRCIRSESDRGAIILMDERFKWGNYRKCFPSDFEFIVTETPVKYLQRFFGQI